MGMERIEFRSDRDNLRSIEAMKSIGCKEEGVLRSNIIKSDKTRRNSIILSILREEWYHEAKAILKDKINRFKAI
jgi:N-acetyltransferase